MFVGGVELARLCRRCQSRTRDRLVMPKRRAVGITTMEARVCAALLARVATLGRFVFCVRDSENGEIRAVQPGNFVQSYEYPKKYEEQAAMQRATVVLPA